MNKILVSLSLVTVLSLGCGRHTVGSNEPASLEELNRVVDSVVMARGAFPPAKEDLEELLKLQGKTMPVAPAGKRLFLDPTARQYRWVEEEYP